jgi:hypothetical protein
MSKENLLVIPEGPGIAGLVLKANLAHRQTHRMAVGKNGAGAAAMAVEYSHGGLLGWLP